MAGTSPAMTSRSVNQRDKCPKRKLLMSNLRLTVACGDYDIVKALKEGAAEAGGLELIFRTDIVPRDRHWRLARNRESDVAREDAGAHFLAPRRGGPASAT